MLDLDFLFTVMAFLLRFAFQILINKNSNLNSFRSHRFFLSFFLSFFFFLTLHLLSHALSFAA